MSVCMVNTPRKRRLVTRDPSLIAWSAEIKEVFIMSSKLKLADKKSLLAKTQPHNKQGCFPSVMNDNQVGTTFLKFTQ